MENMYKAQISLFKWKKVFKVKKWVRYKNQFRVGHI